MKFLITGFEPFLDNLTNPTMEITKALQSNSIDTMVLPVEYVNAAQHVITHLKSHEYDYVLLLGLAANRTQISIEYQAINLMDARGADNAGVIKRMKPIQDGPDVYHTKLPYKRLINAAEKASLPIELSLSAGAYICNDVFYRVRDAYPELNVGFIHVPSETKIPMDKQITLVQWIVQQLSQ